MIFAVLWHIVVQNIKTDIMYCKSINDRFLIDYHKDKVHSKIKKPPPVALGW
jgi:hypothetical protein